jgi:hypothetical protein
MPIFIPQSGDEGLPREGHRVLLAGSLGGLSYPPICPCCGARASEPLPITKVFVADTFDGPANFKIITAAPMFCGTCIARHHAEETPPTTAERIKGALLTENAMPGFGLTALAMFLLYQVETHGAHGSAKQHWVMLGVVAGFLALAYACFRHAWSEAAHKRIAPQTEVTRSFDFGDDSSSMFETRPRTYIIRDAACADAFTRLNAGRSAERLGPAQRRRERRRFWIATAIFGALAIWALFVTHQ